MKFNILNNKANLHRETNISTREIEAIFCMSIIVDIIMFQLDNVYYYLIVLGEKPCVGGTGIILVLLLYYVFFLPVPVLVNSLDRLVSRRVSDVMIILYLLIPIVMLFAYCEFYSNYIENIERKYIEQSHKCIGAVYSKESPGSRSHHYTFRTGVDSIHTREQRISEDSPLIKSIHVGDTIILRVSDEYPRVNRVLNWHPTPEEIEKYKSPVRLIEKN